MKRLRQKTRPEPNIALINVVFLMLVFFMVAGTLAQPMDTDLDLVHTAGLEGREPPDALVIHADGRLSYRGIELVSLADFMPRQSNLENPEIQLVPDRDLPADQLVRIARELRAQGAGRIMIVTERGLE